jgi:hypothetical protein
MAYYPRLYNPGPIEPIVEPGQNLLLQTPNRLELYQVAFIEPIPPSAPVIVNLATTGLTAATSSSGVNTGATPISLQNQQDMNNGELFHVRFRVLDPVTVTLWQGQGLGRNVTRYTQAAFTVDTGFWDPHYAYSEHFVWEQNRAYMIATNYHAHSVGQARVALWGFRYVLAGESAVIASQGGVNSRPIASYKTVAEAISNPNGLKFTIVPISGWGA